MLRTLATFACLAVFLSSLAVVACDPGDLAAEHQQHHEPRAAAQRCPAAPQCEASGDFCADVADLVSDYGVTAWADSLVDACEAGQARCGLCNHLEALCVQSGNEPKSCLEAELLCACAGLAAGAP